MLVISVTLTGCNKLPAMNNEVIVESGPAPSHADIAGPDPSYRDIIATQLKSTFKDYRSYEAFELSTPRRVHSLLGWSWLTCVRFQDHDRRRTYAVFLDGSKVLDARFAVKTDDCGTQAYSVFEQMGGQGLPPLH